MLPSVLRISNRVLPAILTISRNESIAVGSVRPGMILKIEGAYVEVKKYDHKKEGRGGAMGAIEYVDLNSSKIGRVKLGVQQRMDKPDLTKIKLSVQYIDKEKGVIVAADENYEQHEIPLKLAQGAEGFLEPSTTIGLSLDGDVAVKIALPTNVITQIKKQ
jgi:translation elongation factor P/translation initiation factor 5A